MGAGAGTQAERTWFTPCLSSGASMSRYTPVVMQRATWSTPAFHSSIARRCCPLQLRCSNSALRARKDFVEFKSHAPILVVSDGDHAALFAARARGIPSVAIGHDMTFDSSVLLPDLPRLPLTAQRINSLPTKAATRRIAVHFCQQKVAIRIAAWHVRTHKRLPQATTTVRLYVTFATTMVRASRAS